MLVAWCETENFSCSELPLAWALVEPTLACLLRVQNKCCHILCAYFGCFVQIFQLLSNLSNVWSCVCVCVCVCVRVASDMCVVVVGSSNSLCILQLAFNTCDLEPWSSLIASCVGCCRLRRIGHSMDLGGVLLVSSASCVFMFVCCGMAVCHIHNLLPVSTFHKPNRFSVASAGLLLSVWFIRCEIFVDFCQWFICFHFHIFKIPRIIMSLLCLHFVFIVSKYLFQQILLMQDVAILEDKILSIRCCQCSQWRLCTI